MISVVKYRKPENDNFRELSDYVFNYKGKFGDTIYNTNVKRKHLYSWIEGCTCNDDYEFSRQEIIDTQSLNSRSKKSKTYHLILSFHRDDYKKFTNITIREIECKYAKALGFENHQRICGLYRRNDYIYLDIVYNMIEPITYKRKEPFRAYWKLDELNRQIEKEYGLIIDNGRNAKIENKLKNDKHC